MTNSVGPKDFGFRSVVSHISRKTSEMWGTRHFLTIEKLAVTILSDCV